MGLYYQVVPGTVVTSYSVGPNINHVLVTEGCVFDKKDPITIKHIIQFFNITIELNWYSEENGWKDVQYA